MGTIYETGRDREGTEPVEYWDNLFLDAWDIGRGIVVRRAGGEVMSGGREESPGFAEGDDMADELAGDDMGDNTAVIPRCVCDEECAVPCACDGSAVGTNKVVAVLDPRVLVTAPALSTFQAITGSYREVGDLRTG